MDNELVAIDVSLPADTEIETLGTAFIRIDPKLREFFQLCNKREGERVIGFSYDFESLNFGVIIGKE